MSARTRQACPECEGRLRSTDTETVCSECGLVIDEDAIDRGPEWRSFDDDGERVEAGAFCNHACLAAHIDDAELTYGDACEWSPDLEDG